MGIFSRRKLNTSQFPSQNVIATAPITPMSAGKRKLRASVRCINFIQLLEERRVLRRKFRAAVDVVELSNALAYRLHAKCKFRAAVHTVILSDRLVNRPLQQKFDLQVFQDAVSLTIAINHLKRPYQTTITKHHTQDEASLKSGLHKLYLAVDKVLHGGNLEPDPPGIELHGSLVNKSKEFSTLWKFVEDPPPHSE